MVGKLDRQDAVASGDFPGDVTLQKFDLLRGIGIFEIDEGETMKMGHGFVDVAAGDGASFHQSFKDRGAGVFFASRFDLITANSKLIEENF